MRKITNQAALDPTEARFTRGERKLLESTAKKLMASLARRKKGSLDFHLARHQLSDALAFYLAMEHLRRQCGRSPFPEIPHPILVGPKTKALMVTAAKAAHDEINSRTKDPMERAHARYLANDDFSITHTLGLFEQPEPSRKKVSR